MKVLSLRSFCAASFLLPPGLLLGSVTAGVPRDLHTATQGMQWSFNHSWSESWQTSCDPPRTGEQEHLEELLQSTLGQVPVYKRQLLTSPQVLWSCGALHLGGLLLLNAAAECWFLSHRRPVPLSGPLLTWCHPAYGHRELAPLATLPFHCLCKKETEFKKG